jgi:16S rRNA (guanine527-N7)-methyltransferase
MERWNNGAMALSPFQESQLRNLVKVFLEENKKLNLSAHRTMEECWEMNVIDSLAVLDVLGSGEQLAASGKLRVIDVGTGGGFPALPLAIIKPEWEITAFDATRKKVEAVQRIVEALRIAGCALDVELLVGRAEELGHREDLRERFDLVLSRAIAELPTLLEYMSPFARREGLIVCWKSMGVDEELRASKRAQEELRCPFWDSFVYERDGGERLQLLFFKKEATLPGMYPRGTGLPKKKPLC